MDCISHHSFSHILSFAVYHLNNWVDHCISIKWQMIFLKLEIFERSRVNFAHWPMASFGPAWHTEITSTWAECFVAPIFGTAIFSMHRENLFANLKGSSIFSPSVKIHPWCRSFHWFYQNHLPISTMITGSNFWLRTSRAFSF